MKQNPSVPTVGVRQHVNRPIGRKFFMLYEKVIKLD